MFSETASLTHWLQYLLAKSKALEPLQDQAPNMMPREQVGLLTSFVNRSVILEKGEILAIGKNTSLKEITRELRTNGGAYNSFPSGHTTQAFDVATFFERRI